MIQDKVHSVKTEQEKCSVFFALLGQSSPFILQEMGFLKNSTTYNKAKELVKSLKFCYHNRCRANGKILILDELWDCCPWVVLRAEI